VLECWVIGVLKKHTDFITPLLHCSILNAGLPLTSAASRPATETQGPTAQLQKLVAGRGINTTKPGLQAGISCQATLQELPFDNFVRKFVLLSGGRLRKMARQKVPGFFDRFHQCVGEILFLEMRAHSLHELLPKLVSAFLMDTLIADHGKLARARSHKNQDAVAFPGGLHAQLGEFPARVIEGVAFQFASLNVDTNFPRAFPFDVADRRHDSIVIEFPEKILRSHRVYQLPLDPPPPKLPPPPLKPLKPPPEDPLDQPPPLLPPPQPPRNGPPTLEYP
jgi:hypothetical protein